MTFFTQCAFFFFFVPTSPAFAKDNIERKIFDAEKKVKTLEVENSSGNIRVILAVDNKISVEAKKIGFGEGCELTIMKYKKAVLAAAKVKGAFNTNECRVDFTLQIPAKMAMKLRTVSGEIYVDGPSGGLTLNTVSGDSELHGEFNFIEASSFSGDFKVSGLSRDIRMKSGSGNIALTFIKTPLKSNVEMELESGDVQILMPAETKVWTRLRSGSGDTENTLREASDALVRIEIKTDSGDIKIKPL